MLAIEDYIRGLPLYLGFGALNQRSIAEGDGALTARYLKGEELVNEVRVTPERSEITEFHGGDRIGDATGRRLGEAFLLLNYGIAEHTHPRLQDIRNRFCTDHDIGFRINPDGGFVTCPAGLILGLRQPLTARNLPAWEAVERVAEGGEASPLRIGGFNQGCVLKLAEDGAVLCAEVALGDLSTLLLDLENALELVSHSGVVPAEREHRLTIMSVEQFADGRVCAYPGDSSRGFLTFSVVDLPPAELEKYGVSDLFRQASEQLLAATSG